MARRRPAVWLASLSLLAAGCSTHEPQFESQAPPAPVDGPSRELLDATGGLLALPTSRLVSTPPDALTSLTSASATTFLASGSPVARRLTRRYAEALLDARIRIGDVTAYYSSADPDRPDPETTALAGIAMLDAWAVTGDERFRAAARDATVAVTSVELGWVADDRAAGVVAPGARRRSVALTATAYLLLGRAAAEVDTPTRDEASAALATVDDAQAAVGRWYANVGDTRTPMNLEQWARTLDALTASRRPNAQGIAVVGRAAMFSSAFDENARVRSTPITRDDPTGVALALAVLARAGDRTRSDLAFERILGRLRSDGTVDLAAEGDVEPQAAFALAFARRQLQLRRQARS